MSKAIQNSYKSPIIECETPSHRIDDHLRTPNFTSHFPQMGKDTMDSEGRKRQRQSCGELEGTGQEKDSLLIWLQLPGRKVSSKSSMRVPVGAIKSHWVPEEGEFRGVSGLSYRSQINVLEGCPSNPIWWIPK